MTVMSYEMKGVGKMIPLDQFEKCLPLMEEGARLYLNEMEYKEFSSIPDCEIANQLKDILEKPINSFTYVNEVYFRARWAEVLKLLNTKENIKLLEVASGDADMIPKVMSFTHQDSNYITANMNKILNKSLIDKTQDLNVKIDIIEDNAMCIESHIGKDVVDIIAFQHSINDVIQAILCDKEGVDTIYSDWMDTLPKMIEILQKEISQNTLEQHAKVPFLELMKELMKVLKKGGIVVMNHYLFQLDLDWGYPQDLFENMVPMTREWLQELPGYKEIYFDGFHPNWWIFLEKV